MRRFAPNSFSSNRFKGKEFEAKGFARPPSSQENRGRRRSCGAPAQRRPEGPLARERIIMIFQVSEGGLPHSEIRGSKLIRSSPRLIAAYHVLHRLCMPRHPPNALLTLDRSHCQYRPIKARISVFFDMSSFHTRPPKASGKQEHAERSQGRTPKKSFDFLDSLFDRKQRHVRPASRDVSGGARSGNANRHDPQARNTPHNDGLTANDR